MDVCKLLSGWVRRSVAEGSASISFSEKQTGEMESSVQHKLKAHTHGIWKVVCNYNLAVMIELNWCPRNNILGEYLKFIEIALLPGNGLKYRGFRSSPRIPPSSWTLMVKSECVLFSVLGRNQPTNQKPTQSVLSVNGILKRFETKSQIEVNCHHLPQL